MHPRQRDAGALGRQDHTTSPSAIGAARQVQPLHVHRIPASHLVTIAKRPSASEAGCRDGMLIFGIVQARYFCGPILNEPVHLILLEKFRFTRSMDHKGFANSRAALEHDRIRSRPTGESGRVSSLHRAAPSVLLHRQEARAQQCAPRAPLRLSPCGTVTKFCRCDSLRRHSVGGSRCR